MTDDFEDQLRAARPAEVPAELLRRLRHAEPAAPFANRWHRLARLAVVSLAVTTFLGILANPLRWFPENSATKRHGAAAKTVWAVDAESREFSGPIAMNIRVGASPDLIPVSLRPAYDDTFSRLSGWPGGDLNLRVETPILNNPTRN